jgi:hypothetical protein
LVAIALETVGTFALLVIAIEKVAEVYETPIAYKPVQGTSIVTNKKLLISSRLISILAGWQLSILCVCVTEDYWSIT